jgi:site-specific DNA recombinase
MIAQYERALITLRLTSGRLRKASLGRFAGGGVPTGYATVDKELAVDPVRMAHIGLIYKLRSEGSTLRDIATALNKQKIPVPRDAKQWWPGAIGYILRNKTYQGQLSYKQHTVQRPDLVMSLTD